MKLSFVWRLRTIFLLLAGTLQVRSHLLSLWRSPHHCSSSKIAAKSHFPLSHQSYWQQSVWPTFCVRQSSYRHITSCICLPHSTYIPSSCHALSQSPKVTAFAVSFSVMQWDSFFCWPHFRRRSFIGQFPIQTITLSTSPYVFRVVAPRRTSKCVRVVVLNSVFLILTETFNSQTNVPIVTYNDGDDKTQLFRYIVVVIHNLISRCILKIRID